MQTLSEAIGGIMAAVFISGVLFLICVAVIAYDDSRNGR